MILETIALILLALLLYCVWIILKIVVYRMAKKRSFFVTVKEGEAVAIMVGDKLYKILMNMKGYHFDKDYNVIAGDSNDIELITRIFPGVYWLGWPGVHTVNKYKFFWIKLNKNNEAEVRDEEVETIYVKDYQYVMPLVKAETRSMVPVSIPILVTLRVVNPYKALFKNDKWLGMVTSAVLARARTFVATFYDPDEIIELSQPQNGISADFGKTIFDLVEKDLVCQETMKRVGAEIVKIETADIDYLSWSELAVAQIEAEKKGDAEIAKATKEGAALLIRTTAEKDANKQLIDELGVDFVLRLRKIEMLGKTNTNTVIDLGNSVEAISSALTKGLLPKMPPTQ